MRFSRRRIERAQAAPERPDFARFGSRSVLMPPSTVTCPQRVEIGEDVVVLPRSWLSVVEEHAGVRYEPRLVIGDRVRLGQDLVIACVGSITIEDDVLASDRVFIGDTYHDYRDPDTPIGLQPMSTPRPVVIGAGAFLGIGAIVLDGVSIGRNAYVGAGAVVTRDVPDRTVVAGNPARVVRSWDPATREWVRPQA